MARSTSSSRGQTPAGSPQPSNGETRRIANFINHKSTQSTPASQVQRNIDQIGLQSYIGRSGGEKSANIPTKRQNGGSIGNSGRFGLEEDLEKTLMGLLAKSKHVPVRTIERAISKAVAEHRVSRRFLAKTGQAAKSRAAMKKGANEATSAKHHLKAKPKLPPLPKGLRWPTMTYSEAHEKHGWDIVQFLKKAGWLPIIRSGALDLRTLREVDPSAAMAISNYTRKDPATGQRRKLPFDIPTTKEKNDRALSKGLSQALRSRPSLGYVIATRLRRGQAVPGA